MENGNFLEILPIQLHHDGIRFVLISGTSIKDEAGAHIDVHINDQVSRQYSLCNDSAESHRYLIAVLRDPKSRGGSLAMHECVNEARKA